ncbi:hypothetical protein BKA70DRAFT_1242078 [Coprinopsis sp. MPI-PUGE-AT-0042]|nr:hypothetical protein BKA70DRAFT_1242078 [Coprinopsis sp. MPI-PUGE-AT-0042]
MPKDLTTSPSLPALPNRRFPRMHNEHRVQPCGHVRKTVLNNNALAHERNNIVAGGIRVVRACAGVPRRDLEDEVKALTRSLKRMRSRLEEKKESILDLKTEIQHLKTNIEEVEKESDNKDELLEAAEKDVKQYRNWWLNEIQFMKLLLNKIPEPNRDIELDPPNIGSEDTPFRQVFGFFALEAAAKTVSEPPGKLASAGALPPKGKITKNA